jgi:hypothetical protein
MIIKNLDNNEISCVYYRFQSYLNDIDSKLDSGYRTEKMDFGDNDMRIQAMSIIYMSEDEVAQIRKSHFYLTVRSIVEKLRPVVEMIEEAEPDIKIKLDE